MEKDPQVFPILSWKLHAFTDTTDTAQTWEMNGSRQAGNDDFLAAGAGRSDYVPYVTQNIYIHNKQYSKASFEQS